MTNQADSVAGGEREDVGAGHGGLARRLDLLLDGVDHFEPARRVGVWSGVLLAGEGRRVVEQDGTVTSLPISDKPISTQHAEIQQIKQILSSA